MGQPGVVGEIIAGIVLGPSLLGYLFPEVHQFILPADSLATLQVLSQIGLCFFMFIIGMELDPGNVRKKTLRVVLISHVSIVVPFILGFGLSFLLYDSFAPPGISFLVFSLFMGTGMSVTAFPVLARILRDRGMDRTELGTLAIMCASIDDISAWCILALVTAIAVSGSVSGVLMIGVWTLVYVCLMLFVLRPLLSSGKVLKWIRGNSAAYLLTGALIMMFASSLATEQIGIHAMFGAFIAGVAMPKDTDIRKQVTGQIEAVSLSLLLPFFFVLTGLKTNLMLLGQSGLWLVTMGIILVAFAGKFGGATVASRLTGLSWKHSLSLGVLMNTRGLMELTVLNIGYDLGIISGGIFTAMVVMTFVTTFTTGPMLNLIQQEKRSRRLKVAEQRVATRNPPSSG
jgi:Kef-type K+ transport system membrane component KefB